MSLLISLPESFGADMRVDLGGDQAFVPQAILARFEYPHRYLTNGWQSCAVMCAEMFVNPSQSA